MDLIFRLFLDQLMLMLVPHRFGLPPYYHSRRYYYCPLLFCCSSVSGTGRDLQTEGKVLPRGHAHLLVDQLRTLPVERVKGNAVPVGMK
jgi:hypothetical protein